MLFNIDIDTGGAVVGWLVLDNPSDTPEFKIKSRGHVDVELRANVYRRDLFDLGLHASGMAGFQVDETLIPNLSELRDLTIVEASSGMPIYSRFDAERHMPRKLLMIEASAMPQVKLLRRLMAHFALQYPMIDRYPLETMATAIGHHYSNSIFVSGRVNWLRFSTIIQPQAYFTVALLGDPYDELAELLILIKLIGRRGVAPFGRYLSDRYETIVPAVSEMVLEDEKSILRNLRGLTREQRRLIRSPMTATFGALPDEELQRRNVSVALENLAQFDVVGTKSGFDQLAGLINGVIRVPLFPDEGLEMLNGATELGHRLRNIALVSDLLDEDIALYSFVEGSLAEVRDRYRHSTAELK